MSRRLVSRTAPSSARVTALVVRPGGWEGEGAATAAARASSAAPVTVLDGTDPLPELLAAIDAAVGTPVLVRVPSDAEHLTQVLALCDRTLAVAGPRVRELPAGAERVDPGVDPARLGRRLAHASVGIAFGAGGAKGWAHVGVLRSLERAGYVVDAVAGSSVGAWVGAWTALGHDAAAVEELLRERFDDYAVHAIFRQGGPQGTAVMTRAARETTQDARFADLAVPLTVLAADLAGKQPAVLDEGPVAQALVTAMTVPGLYPPVRRGAQRLVDAVVLTPVPTSALTGVDVTIAVNLFGSVTSPAWPGATARARRRPERPRPGGRVARAGVARRRRRADRRGRTSRSPRTSAAATGVTSDRPSSTSPQGRRPWRRPSPRCARWPGPRADAPTVIRTCRPAAGGRWSRPSWRPPPPRGCRAATGGRASCSRRALA